MIAGPVSTTLSVDQAAQFAGNSGQLMELYPSFDKKGLDISCISDFPEEQEVLYIDCSFQIANLYHSKTTEYRDFKALIDKTRLNSAQADSASIQYMQSSYLKAIQMISTNSRGAKRLCFLFCDTISQLMTCFDDSLV